VGGFKDTPFIVYMLKTQSWRGQKYIDRVFFEQEVLLNRHWVQVCILARLPGGAVIWIFLNFGSEPFSASNCIR